MLNDVELSELYSSLYEELPEKLLSVLTYLNRTGNLETVLEYAGLSEFIKPKHIFESLRTGIILVVGGISTKKTDLKMTARKLGINDSRIQFYDYNEVKSFDFSTVQYNLDYSAILFGPSPHSGISKGDSSSIMTALLQSEGYPPIRIIGNDTAIKITKSNFKNCLQELLQLGILQKDC